MLRWFTSKVSNGLLEAISTSSGDLNATYDRIPFLYTVHK